MTGKIATNFFCLFCLVLSGPVATAQQSLVPNALTAQSLNRPGRYAAAPSTQPHTVRPVATTASDGTWNCLLFAVERYDVGTQNLPPLRGCHNDMTAVKTEWLNRIGIDDDRIVFLNDHATSATSTQRNFLAELDKLCRGANSNTNLLVAVSSHGIAMNGKSYICPTDVTYRPDSSSWDNLIAVSDLIDKLKSSRAGRKLLIIDACRTQSETSGREDFMSEFATLSKEMAAGKSPSGLAVISSCSLAQEAHEMIVDGRPRGVFMKYFIEGLSGPADYSGVIDGNITLSEAYAYAFSQTSKFVYLCRDKSRQTPELFRENNLISFVLARSEPTRKRPGETDMQFLLRQSMELATLGFHSLASDVLTHVIANEPNNNIAVACRAGTFLATSDYPLAMKDFNRLGRTLDLYLRFSENDNKAFQREIDRLKTAAEQKEYIRKNRKVRILADKNPASEAKAVLEPGQKVSISGIDGSWYFVSRIDDDVAQDGVGWIHKDNLTWSPERVERYRPQTVLHTPDGGGEKIGGLNFRQQSGMAGGGGGRGVMQRFPGGGGGI